MGNQGGQGKPDREGNIGQTGETRNPTGTSGRENPGGEKWQQGNKDTNRPDSDRDKEDEDTGIGTRDTNR
jgi:hypothetical protein